MSSTAVPQKPHWSITVLLLAADEAIRSLHDTIQPVHVLIALCRLVDAAQDEAPQAERAIVQSLRSEMDAFGIPPQQFRRRLRSLIASGGVKDAAHRVKTAIAGGRGATSRIPGIIEGTACSPAARAAIRRAVSLAGPSAQPDARHLLRALLIGEVEGVAAAPDDIPDRL